MDVSFDVAKDRTNLAKHGVALADATDLQVLAVVPDDRFDGEQRYRLYGMLHGAPYCLAAVLRDDVVRAISLRRAHLKEFRRHVR